MIGRATVVCYIFSAVILKFLTAPLEYIDLFQSQVPDLQHDHSMTSHDAILV